MVISLGTLLVVVAGLAGYLAWPLVFPAPAGASGQEPVSGYPSAVSATGEDGRVRILEVSGESGGVVDLSEVRPGQRLVVSGSGYDPTRGIYVAICRIPDSPDLRPGPCLGGVPDTEAQGDDGERAIEWAPANWINDDWAWKLFGARGFDDPDEGTFTAYLEVGPAADEFVDCRRERCGVFTRNDHTALANRLQDVYLPVSFGE